MARIIANCLCSYARFNNFIRKKKSFFHVYKVHFMAVCLFDVHGNI
jgi:hypothetical protein